MLADGATGQNAADTKERGTLINATDPVDNFQGTYSAVATSLLTIITHTFIGDIHNIIYILM